MKALWILFLISSMAIANIDSDSKASLKEASNASEELRRKQWQMGVDIGVLMAPIPRDVSVIARINILDFLQLRAAYADSRNWRLESERKYGVGVRVTLAEWPIAPYLSVGMTFDPKYRHPLMNYSAGFDWQTFAGFSFGIGLSGQALAQNREYHGDLADLEVLNFIPFPGVWMGWTF